MVYQVRLLKGIFEPQRSRYQLQNAEAVTRIGWKLLLLYIMSLIVFTAGSYFGIGTDSYSKQITNMSPAEFEAGRLLVVVGNMIAGIMFPTLYLFLASLFFWMVGDISYIKTLIVQMILLVVALMEKVLLIPIFVMMDIGYDANPFSLGVISQYFLRNEYFIHFFSEVTIFQILIMAMQYYYLKTFTERSKSFVLIMIILFYIATWFVKAFLAYLQVGVII